jgi:RNA polymerase sigma-70 factor (ECF subfamily)
VSALVDAFLKTRPGDGDDLAALGAELDGARARARAAWPGIDVADASFGEALAQRIPAADEAAAVLRSMHVEDVYLVTACVQRDAAAMGALQSRFLPPLRAALLQRGLTEDATSETLQIVLQQVFVGAEAAPPKALGYNGQGALRSWLRIVAIREGIRIAKNARPAGCASETSIPDPQDLELDYLKRTYASPFRDAFREAFDAMATEDRLLLKQRITHGMSIEQLGALYGVHESTISRRVTSARARLVGATRKGMMRRLSLSRAEASSIMRLIQSQLDITLSSSQAVSTGTA